MTCPMCGPSHAAGSKFCRGCGARVDEQMTESAAVTCTQCNHENAAGTRFCKACGTPRGAVHAATPATVSDQPPAETADALSQATPMISTPLTGTEAAEAEGEAPSGVDAPARVQFAARADRPAESVRPNETKAPTARVANKGRVVAIAVGTIAIVGMVGTLVAYKLLRHDDGATVGSTSTTETSAAAAAPDSAGSSPSVLKSNETASMAATPASAKSAPAVVTPQTLPQPESSMVVVARPTTLPRDESVQAANSAPNVGPQETMVAVEQPRPDAVADQRAGQFPIRAANDQQTSTPTPRKAERAQVPADALAASKVQDIALNLARKGEIAFSHQDYSTAIANARAALEVKPGFARAQNLLEEAQRAQQQAMNSISIQ